VASKSVKFFLIDPNSRGGTRFQPQKAREVGQGADAPGRGKKTPFAFKRGIDGTEPNYKERNTKKKFTSSGGRRRRTWRREG